MELSLFLDVILLFLVVKSERDIKNYYQSDYCIERKLCGNGDMSFPCRTCHCDDLCHVLEDCCEDENDNIFQHIPLEKDQFVCYDINVYIRGMKSKPKTLNSETGVSVVAKCSPFWDDNATRALCEQENAQYLSYRTPVNGILGKHVVVSFRNMYCAYCNMVYDINKWSVMIMNGTTDDLFFVPPASEYRQCPKSLTQACACSNNTYINETLANLCAKSSVNFVYSSKRAFKNEFCAQCNNINDNSISCELLTLSIPYAYWKLVDIDQTSSCGADEVFEPFKKVCHQIVCRAPYFPYGGRCIQESNVDRNISTNGCVWITVHWNDTKLVTESDGTLMVYYAPENKYYQSGRFAILHRPEVWLCIDWNEANVPDETENYISTVGVILSLFGLTATSVVYCIFSKQLLNRPGKILLCFTSSLFLAQLQFLMASAFESIQNLCISTAISVHYCYLASFCWMNIFSLDLLLTLYGMKQFQKMSVYNAYGWCVPLLIVGTAVTFNFATIDSDYAPDYGKTSCWISSRNGILFFMLIPTGVFTFFNVVNFVFVVVRITKEGRIGAKARSDSNNRYLALIVLKLSLTVGLTWSFAFLAISTGSTVFRYLFVVFNTLQGLFVGICFLCTKKVYGLIKEECHCICHSFQHTMYVTSSTTEVKGHSEH